MLGSLIPDPSGKQEQKGSYESTIYKRYTAVYRFVSLNGTFHFSSPNGKVRTSGRNDSERVAMMAQDVDPADTYLKPLTDSERARFKFEFDFGYELIVNA